MARGESRSASAVCPHRGGPFGVDGQFGSMTATGAMRMRSDGVAPHAETKSDARRNTGLGRAPRPHPRVQDVLMAQITGQPGPSYTVPFRGDDPVVPVAARQMRPSDADVDREPSFLASSRQARKRRRSRARIASSPPQPAEVRQRPSVVLCLRCFRRNAARRLVQQATGQTGRRQDRHAEPRVGAARQR